MPNLHFHKISDSEIYLIHSNSLRPLVLVSLDKLNYFVTESIEIMRDASIDVLDDVPKYETPLKTVDDLLNISSTSSSPHQPSPLRKYYCLSTFFPYPEIFIEVYLTIFQY